MTIRRVDLYRLETDRTVAYMRWLAIWRSEATRLDAYRQVTLRREHPGITIRLFGAKTTKDQFRRIAAALKKA